MELTEEQDQELAQVEKIYAGEKMATVTVGRSNGRDTHFPKEGRLVERSQEIANGLRSLQIQLDALHDKVQGVSTGRDPSGEKTPSFNGLLSVMSSSERYLAGCQKTLDELIEMF